jgi:hypothetical protein
MALHCLRHTDVPGDRAEEPFLRKESHQAMDDLIYVLVSLGLFVAFAAAVFGYERVK